MTVAVRVSELLADVSIEDRLRGREIADAAAFLGVSEATAYRYIASGSLPHVKLEGIQRRGRGRAGAVRVRLLDLVTFQVQNERSSTAAGAARRTS